MTSRVDLEHITIFLVEPQIPENIGSAARAMHNMGLKRLMLVRPKNCDLSRVLKTATGTSVDLIEEMGVCEDLTRALAPFQYVAGTTARTGNLRPALTDPRNFAEDLIALSQANEVAILFGPEDRGLSNEQLRLCHTIVTIPTARFASLNLAQAVMIVCYELWMAADEKMNAPAPRLADTFEREGMYTHLSQVLQKIGFINPQNPEHWMFNVRRLFARHGLRAREAQVIKGICRQIDWYVGKRLEAKQK